MFWKCIMFPATHKEALQLNNERVKLQWHPAFCAAARLEFNEDRDVAITDRPADNREE